MTIREREKEITLEEQRYVLHRFDARTGTFMLKVIAEKALPLWQAFLGLAGENQKPTDGMTKEEIEARDNAQNAAFIDMIIRTLMSITDDDIDKIMGICLKNTDKILRSGATPIMDGSRFAIEDLEFDTVLCLKLCAQSIMFNFSDFFGEGGLSSILGGLSSSPHIP